MLAGHGRGGTYGAAAAVVVATGLLGVAVVLQQVAAVPPAAVLTVYEGTANVGTAASSNLRRGLSGDGLEAGDAVTTGADTKASITYANESQVRLDSNTSLRLDKVSRGVGGAVKADAYQSIGKTWSRLSSLAGGSTYSIHAPNSTTAEVRGTEFEVIVEVVDGQTVVRINVFTGIVAVTADGVTVILTAGQSTTIGPAGAAPQPPQPISPADLQDSFTVFNQTLDKTGGVPVAFNSGQFTPPQSTGLLDGAVADGNSDLQFTLGWPGSRFELEIYAPGGDLYQTVSSGAPPASITVYQAAAGLWKYRVTDLQSLPGEAWWVIISRISPSQHGAASLPPPGSPAPSGPGLVAPQTITRPTGHSDTTSPASSPSPTTAAPAPPAAPPSPSPEPESSPSPEPEPSPSPEPESSPSPQPSPSPEPSDEPPPPPPSPSPAPPPPPSSPPPTPPAAVTIRGNGSIAAASDNGGALCRSGAGVGVRFNLRAQYQAGGSEADPHGTVTLGFATADSCAPDQPEGPKTYDVSSKALEHVDATSSPSGVETMVFTFGRLNMTDETTAGKRGAVVVECSRFTLRVVVVTAHGGPRSALVGFQILDGDGRVVWSSGPGPLVTGSLIAG